MMKTISSLLMVLYLTGCERDAAPKGEGSIEAGKRMFAEIGKVASGTVPPGYSRLEFDDGSWVAVKGIDSHESPDGGTIGMVTNSGEAAVFFTHVCGPGPTPLEGLFTRHESAGKALESLRASTKEYKR